MKKMTKGAIVTGLGVALLLGGGGTLALWEAEANAEGGTIASGDLDVTALNKNPWSSNLTGPIVSTNDKQYKIVPGEVLTYEQKVDVDLAGDRMKAVLKVVGLDGIEIGSSSTPDGLFGNTLTPTITVDGPGETSSPTNTLTSPSTLASTDGVVLDGNARNGIYTVKTTLAFDANLQQDVNSTLNLEEIAFRLEQQTPTSLVTPAP